MKKIFYRGLVLMAFVTSLLVSFKSIAQTDREFTKKQATRWFNKWAKDHNAMNPDHIIDIQEFAKQYHRNQAWWDEAFAYLKNTDLAALKPGRYQINGDNVSIVVSEGPSREYSDTRWESHRRIADIHYLISGGEMVGIAPLATATVTKPFAGTLDTAIYTTTGKTFSYSPDSYFIIFPNQVHQPGVKASGYDRYKKIVVKVKVI